MMAATRYSNIVPAPLVACVEISRLVIDASLQSEPLHLEHSDGTDIPVRPMETDATRRPPTTSDNNRRLDGRRATQGDVRDAPGMPSSSGSRGRILPARYAMARRGPRQEGTS